MADFTRDVSLALGAVAGVLTLIYGLADDWMYALAGIILLIITIGTVAETEG